MTELSLADLERFLEGLARRVPCRVRVILTGGVEALLLGGVRPTGDVDFGVHPSDPERWREVELAIAEAADEARVVVQYSEDIDRWSSVSIPKTRFRTRPYRRIGRLSVHLVDPLCWAVYKLVRYLDSDVEDLVAVLATNGLFAKTLPRLCGESLRASPRSPSLFVFRKQVEHFFDQHGKRIWGPRFDPEKAIAVFREAAGIRSEG